MSFAARVDRYNHDLGEDTDETEDSILFSSFSSYTPQYKKVQPKLNYSIEDANTSNTSCRKFIFRCDSDTSECNTSSNAFPGKLFMVTVQKTGPNMLA